MTFNLVDAKEMAPLQSLIEQLLEKDAARARVATGGGGSGGGGRAASFEDEKPSA